MKTQECLLEREIAALKRELHGARGLAETERQTVRLYGNIYLYCRSLTKVKFFTDQVRLL